jgi:hypothetical protein
MLSVSWLRAYGIRPTSAPRSDGPDERKRPGRLGPGQLDEQTHVKLGGDDGAREDDARGGQYGQSGIDRAVLQRASKHGRVGHIGGIDHVVRDRAQPLYQPWCACQHEIGTGGKACLGRAKRGRIDARLGGNIIDAVVDHQLRLEHFE